MKIVGSEWGSVWFWLEDKLYELSTEDLKSILDSTKDNEVPYCSICRGCGEEGCCSPLSCKQHPDGDYCETNLQHLKFGYVMYDKIMELIEDDEKYKEQIDNLYDETYDKIYRIIE